MTQNCTLISKINKNIGTSKWKRKVFPKIQSLKDIEAFNEITSKYARDIKIGYQQSITSLSNYIANINVKEEKGIYQRQKDNKTKKQLSITKKNFKKKLNDINRVCRQAQAAMDVLIIQAIENQTQYLNNVEFENNSIQRYRYDSRFIIDFYHLEFIKGYNLLLKFGVYDSHSNVNGVVKDHRLSVWFGYTNNVPATLTGHLANCEFLRYKDNIKKSKNSSLSVNELLNEIKKFNWFCNK
jgi:hypothetical protein